MERDLAGAVFNVVASISTHTLTWSVTFLKEVLIMAKYDFNSHAHVERDNVIIFSVISIFISTHTLTWSVTYQYHGCL